MGLNEEPGIIPRFCEDLFAQVAKKQTSEVCINSNHNHNHWDPLHGLKDDVLGSRLPLFSVVWRRRGKEVPNAEKVLPGGQWQRINLWSLFSPPFAVVLCLVVHAAFEFSVLLPSPPECWDSRCAYYARSFPCFSPLVLCSGLQGGSSVRMYVSL